MMIIVFGNIQFKNESIELLINNLFTSINTINIPTQLHSLMGISLKYITVSNVMTVSTQRNRCPHVS